MKKSYILPFLTALLLATGCSKEDPFGYSNEGEGQFLKSALDVDLNPEAVEYRRTRANADIDDFTIIFNSSESSAPEVKYLYKDMPEIVVLPAGSYTVTATYGKNLDAEWESPYFLGVSKPFEVYANDITTDIDPIVCNLENIKVTVAFDKSLRDHMSSNSYVDVKVGHSSALAFSTVEADAEKAGYFMHSEERTLVAEFHGTVDGAEILEVKSLDEIKKGAHYKINFRLHQSGDSDSNGDVNLGGIVIDANVEVVNVNNNVPLGEEELLDDSERPKEGELPSGPGTENPGEGDNPGGDVTAKAPTIEAVAPVKLDVPNNGADLTSCVLNIHSDAGITELTCDIVSPSLVTALFDMGLSDHLDLAETPADMEEILGNMGFPTSVKGDHDVKFEITEMFLGLLGNLGAGEHKFVITVKDANGELTKSLIITYNE